jgi:hypothetical protein
MVVPPVIIQLGIPHLGNLHLGSKNRLPPTPLDDESPFRCQALKSMAEVHEASADDGPLDTTKNVGFSDGFMAI